MNDGNAVESGPVIVDGDQRSPFEAMCTVTIATQNLSTSAKTFVYSFNVSVSNDGNNFSNEMEIYVFDGTCQEIVVSSGVISFNLNVSNSCKTSVIAE